MSGSSSRRQAIKAVMSYEKEPAGFTEPMGDTFGRNVFGLSEMRKRLPKHVFKAVAATIDSGASMDPQIADYVAVGLSKFVLVPDQPDDWSAELTWLREVTGPLET